jgi:hypothetical protein
VSISEGGIEFGDDDGGRLKGARRAIAMVARFRVQVTDAMDSRADHLYSLDLLRFLAAPGVVLVHWCCSPVHEIMHLDAACYGDFGVHFFFMISGFAWAPRRSPPG